MCDKCNEIDEKITHYKRISQHIADQLTQDRLNKVFEAMTAQKTVLHAEQAK